MKKIIIFCLLLSAIVVTVISCSKNNTTNNTTTPTTVAEDKTFLTNEFNTTLNCITNVRDGLSMQALISFLALSNGTVSNDAWIQKMSNSLKNQMGQLQLNSNDSKFNFSNYYGNYTWNFSTQSFTKTAATGIIINFPSEQSKTTNNSTLKFLTYSDGLYQANAKSIYLPTNAKITLDKDNVQIASVDFTGNYSTGSFPNPISVVLSVSMNPHNYKVTIGQITSTQFSVKVELGGDCNSVIDGKVSFVNDDYNNFKLEDDLDKVQFTYTKGDMSVVTNWDARTYYSLSTTTTTNLNSTFTSYVYNKTNKIGDLKFFDVGNQRKLFIYYKDGTSENTSFYYDPFTAQLKTILRPYFGNKVDSWF